MQMSRFPVTAHGSNLLGSSLRSNQLLCRPRPGNKSNETSTTRTGVEFWLVEHGAFPRKESWKRPMCHET